MSVPTRRYDNEILALKSRIEQLEDIINKHTFRINANERGINRYSATPTIDRSGSRVLVSSVGTHSHPDTELDFFNGIFLEKFHALATSNGTVITMTLTEINGNNLTMNFSDGYTTFDVTSGNTIALTAGTDANPQTNYIYILQSGKVLAKSTTSWPDAEHIKIGQFGVPSAVFVQTYNVYLNQNSNEGTDLQGHLPDMAQKMRQFGADYFSGIDPNGTSDYLTIAASNVEFKSGAGVVWQIHPHTFGAFDTSTGDLVLVKNWNGDSYHDITDLFDIIADSAGVSLANKWFKIVVWGIGNKEGELDFIVINLPSASYTTEAKATEDKNNYTDYGIPRQYSIESSTGFLICEIVVKQQTTWDYGSTKNLRGLSSASAVAGAVGTGITDHDSLTGIVSDNHHAPTVAGDLDHNDLANIDAGDIKHLTAAQVAVLHAIFTPAGVDAHTDLTITGAQIEDLLMFGSGNSAWIPTARYNAQDNLTDTIARWTTNLDGNDFWINHVLPLPTNKGTLKLYIKGIKLPVFDADANDYISQVNVYGIVSYTGETDVYTDASTGTNVAGGERMLQDGVASMVAWGAATDMSSYEYVAVLIRVVATTSGEIEFGVPLLDCYYA